MNHLMLESCVHSWDPNNIYKDKRERFVSSDLQLQDIGHELSSLAFPALTYISTLSHKRYDFRKKKMLLNIKSVFLSSLQNFSEIFS